MDAVSNTILGNPTVSCLVTKEVGWLGGLIELACGLPSASYFALFEARSALPDLRLSRTLLRDMQSSCVDYAYVLGAPEGSTPRIFTCRLLSALGELSASWPEHVDVDVILDTINSHATEESSLFGKVVVDAYQLCASEHVKLPCSVLVQSEMARFATERTLAEKRTDLELLGSAKRYRVHLEAAERTEQHVTITAGRTDKRRVLFATRFLEFSGAEQSFLQLIQGLPRSVYLPALLVPAECLLAVEARRVGCEVLIVDNLLDEVSLRTTSTISSIITKSGVDIIHINVDAGAVLPFVANQLHIPTVLHCRTIELTALPAWCSFITHFLAVSNLVASNIVYRGARPETVTSIYNGVDFAQFVESGHDNRVVWRLAPSPTLKDGPAVVMIGRITPQKRQDFFVRAMHLACSQNRDAFGMLCGEPGISDLSYFKSVMSMAASLGLEDRLCHAGFVHPITAAFRRARVLALCTQAEPFARCVLEAACFGVPCVAPDFGGHTEAFADRESIILYDGRSASDCAQSIVDLLSDRGLHARIAAGAKKVAIEVSLERHVSGVCSLYDRILNQRGLVAIRTTGHPS